MEGCDKEGNGSRRSREHCESQGSIHILEVKAGGFIPGEERSKVKQGVGLELVQFRLLQFTAVLCSTTFVLKTV